MKGAVLAQSVMHLAQKCRVLRWSPRCRQSLEGVLVAGDVRTPSGHCQYTLGQDTDWQLIQGCTLPRLQHPPSDPIREITVKGKKITHVTSWTLKKRKITNNSFLIAPLITLFDILNHTFYITQRIQVFLNGKCSTTYCQEKWKEL